MSNWVINVVSVLCGVVLVGQAGCAGVSAHAAEPTPTDSSEVEVLRARLAIPTETPVGTLVEGAAGDTWVALVFEGAEVPIARVSAPPDDAETGREVDRAGSWFLFPSSPPVALQLADEASFWAVGRDGSIVHWPAVSIAQGERLPFEVVSESDGGAASTYASDLVSERPGAEQITIEPRSLEVRDAEGERLLYAHFPREQSDRGELRELASDGTGAVAIVVNLDWYDGGGGVDHSWSGEYRFRWVPGSPDLTVVTSSERYSDWYDRTNDLWDVLDVDFDSSPEPAGPGDACWAEGPSDLTVTRGDDELLAVAQFASMLASPASIVSERYELAIERAHYDGGAGALLTREAQRGTIQLLGLNTETLCGLRLEGEYRSSVWTVNLPGGAAHRLHVAETGPAVTEPVRFRRLSR